MDPCYLCEAAISPRREVLSASLPCSHGLLWQCCPYLVAVQGEPGGAAERSTVKRGQI